MRDFDDMSIVSAVRALCSMADAEMVRSGYAALFTYPPDVKYVTQIRDAQRFAHDHGYGLWSSCETTPNGDTNDLTTAPPTATQPTAPAPPGNTTPVLRAEGPENGPQGLMVRIWFANGT